MKKRDYGPHDVKAIFLLMVLLTIGVLLTVGFMAGGPLLEFTALAP